MSHSSVRVDLARPTYRLGGTVVGTVDLGVEKHHSSVQLTAVGFCRLDPRWHNNTQQDLEALIPKEGLSIPPNLPLPPNTAVFWSSNCAELTGLSTDELPYYQSQEEQKSPNVVTFRFRLPLSAPSTLIAASCRYFYGIVVRVLLSTGQEEWVQAPVPVLTALNNTAETINENDDDSDCLQVTSGVPYKLTPSELECSGYVDGQFNINRQSPAVLRHIRSSNVVKIDDPKTKRRACTLTLLGATTLHPGSSILVQFDFADAAIPCHLASACLQGVEMSIGHDGSRKRARRYQFDTAYNDVNEYTESISLQLSLPVSAPCTLSTNVVDISTELIIDLAVGDGGNIHLEIPCNVSHSVAGWEVDQDNNGDDTPLCIPGRDIRSRFRTRDIRNDLKILALAKCSG